MKDYPVFPWWANALILVMGGILAHSVTQSLSILSIVLYWTLSPEFITFSAFNVFRLYGAISAFVLITVALSLLIDHQLKRYVVCTAKKGEHIKTFFNKFSAVIIIPIICYCIVLACVYVTSISIEHQQMLANIIHSK